MEYVVSAPQNPAPATAITPAAAGSAARKPSTADPTTFTVTMPQGNTERVRALTARSAR